MKIPSDQLFETFPMVAIVSKQYKFSYTNQYRISLWD
jgi:hypothetical protein